MGGDIEAGLVDWAGAVSVDDLVGASSGAALLGVVPTGSEGADHAGGIGFVPEGGAGNAGVVVIEERFVQGAGAFEIGGVEVETIRATDADVLD